MTTTKPSPDALVECLRRLRVQFLNRPRPAEEIAVENKNFADALAGTDDESLRLATTMWLRDETRFPRPASLLRVALKLQAEAASSAQRRKEQARDEGSDHRNEAIQLLGPYEPTVRRHYGDDTKAYNDTIAEAARLWAKVRPDGGLKELDEQRGRGPVGFALEAWARDRLGLPLLDPAYATARGRSVFMTMLGREMPVSSTSEPLAGSSGLARPMASALQTIRGSSGDGWTPGA